MTDINVADAHDVYVVTQLMSLMILLRSAQLQKWLKTKELDAWQAQCDGHPLGGSELRSYFSPFMDQSTPN